MGNFWIAVALTVVNLLCAAWNFYSPHAASWSIYVGWFNLFSAGFCASGIIDEWHSWRVASGRRRSLKA